MGCRRNIQIPTSTCAVPSPTPVRADLKALRRLCRMVLKVQNDRSGGPFDC
jgi:hypothetical protein